MSVPDDAADSKAQLALDERFYRLEGKELAFFQEQTGISDETHLKRHIISVQGKAYEVGVRDKA